MQSTLGLVNLSLLNQARKSGHQRARDGPWNAIPNNNIIPLATGDIESLSVDWRGKSYTMTRKDGVEALSKIKGSKINHAHDALIKAASSDDSELRIAALNAMPEIAEQNLASCLIISVYYLMTKMST